MHELGTVFYIIDELEKVCKENSLTKVGSVTLEIGEVSGIIPDYLSKCWDWAVERTDFMKGAKLKIETLPAVTYCQNCEKTYPTMEYGKTCPYCQSGDTYLLTGNEYNIREIEAM
jgi:hydrogenase nickel incorporation protein HypA/HybF